MLQRTIAPVIAAAIGRAAADRVVVRAKNRVAANLELSLGGAVSAVCVGIGTPAAMRALVLINRASYVVCAVVALALPAIKGEAAGRWRRTSRVP